MRLQELQITKTLCLMLLPLVRKTIITTLSDGQHRTLAVKETGVPIRTMITWGVDGSAQLVTDRRGSRSLKDDLDISGFKNTSNVAAIARILYLLDTRGFTPYAVINSGAATSSVSDVVLFEYFKSKSETIIDLNKLVSRVRDSVRDLSISSKVLNVLVIEFQKVNETDAQEFWHRLSNGITQIYNDPIIVLRKRLSDNAKSKINRLSPTVEAALIIKTWNYYMRGETVGTLKFSCGGAKPEKFPEIYNPYVIEENYA